jgi:hypothetical protein
LGQRNYAAAQLNGVNETVRIEKDVHVADFPDAHTSMVSGGPILLGNGLANRKISSGSNNR